MAIEEIDTDIETIGYGKHHYENVDTMNRNFAELAAGSGAGSNALTDEQLRASPVAMVPMLNASGNIEVAVATVNTPVQLPSQEAKQITLANFTNGDGWVIQDGKRFPLFPMAYFTFFGITNSNQLSVQLATAGTVYGHWES